jgi:hypothetical protein
MVTVRQILITVLVVVLAVVSGRSAGGFQIAPRADDAERDPVESYLAGLGLNELLVAYFEQQLDRQVDAQRRKQLAARLAELYTQQLLSPTTSYSQSLKWQLKAQQLVQVYPDLDDPVLQIAIFHARYKSINNDFDVWWQAGHLPGQRQQLQESFRQLIRDLLQLKRRMETQRRELAIDRDINPETASLTEIQLARVDNVLLHSQYLIGWGSYFRAIVEPENSTEWLSMSESHFRSFLQIEPDNSLLAVTGKWLDFEDGWTSRGLIGLALCKQVQGFPDISQHCFALAVAGDDSGVEDLVEIWRMRGLVYANQLNDAVKLVENTVATDQPIATPVFWVAVVKNGSAISGEAREAGNRMMRTGLVGLMRQRQAGLIRELISELNIKLESSDFLSLWITGLLALDDAEQHDDRNKRETAKIRLTQALALATEQVNPADHARCEFLLASIRFRDREFETVEPMFARVVNALKESDRDVAAQAMWLRIQALVELGRNDPRRSSQAFALMDQLLRIFPESPQVDRIDFEKLKLNMQNIPDQEAIRRLERIGPDSEFHTDARYEMIQRQHRLWLDSLRNGRADRGLLETLTQWEQEYRSDPDATAPRKLKLLLLVVDARLRETPVDTLAIKQMLDSADALAQPNRESQAELYLEYQYYRFLFFQQTNVAEAVAQAAWIAENAIGTRYEQPALICLSQQWEQRVGQAEIDPDQLSTGIKIYQRLSAIAGNEPEQIKNSTNSRVAAIRLAELLVLQASWVEADRIYAKLLQCFPDDRNFLVAAARCKTKLDRFDLAEPIWRRLSAGVEAGTDLWYESKYQLAVCLARTDPLHAAKLTRQTIQLSPDMPNRWRKKFTELQATFNEE